MINNLYYCIIFKRKLTNIFNIVKIFYFFIIFQIIAAKIIPIQRIKTIVAPGDASKQYEPNNQAITAIIQLAAEIIFICLKLFHASFQIFAGRTINAQISKIQNIFIATAISKLVRIRKVIFDNSVYFCVAFEIS